MRKQVPFPELVLQCSREDIGKTVSINKRMQVSKVVPKLTEKTLGKWQGMCTSGKKARTAWVNADELNEQTSTKTKIW